MFQTRKKARVGYEDLMRELESMERHLMTVDGSAAMNLMVLEAKIRERFQQLDGGTWESPRMDGYAMDDLSYDEIQDMIPRDVADPFPPLDDLDVTRKRKRMFETVGVAALLAVFTAVGVFALASVLQLTLSWLI